MVRLRHEETKAQAAAEAQGPELPGPRNDPVRRAALEVPECGEAGSRDRCLLPRVRPRGGLAASSSTARRCWRRSPTSTRRPTSGRSRGGSSAGRAGRTCYARGCTLVSGELKLKKPYTTTGLAVWLDTSRLTLLNYEIRPEFFNTIKRRSSGSRITARSSSYDKNVPTKGVTFSLSNNHQGWAEKIETKDTSLADLIKAQEAGTPRRRSA